MAVINWEKEASKSNPIFPEGVYKVVIDSFEKVTASTGTKQIRWRAKIVEPVEHANRIIIDHTALTEKSLWRVANLVRSCGVDLSSLTAMETNSSLFDSVLKACVGRQSIWRNVQATDPKGNPKNSIAEYIEVPDQEVLKFEDPDNVVPDFIKENKEW